MSCTERVAALLRQALREMAPLHRTRGARRTVADALAELRACRCQREDASAEYERANRAAGDRIRGVE